MSRSSSTAAILAFPGKRPRPCVDPSKRGHHVAYRGDGHDRCPGCGRSHWYVGRLSAECAFCTTAIPLAGNADVVSGGRNG